MRFRIKYGSHIPVLVKLLSITDGAVLEMGGGWCSTPVLHWLCEPKKRFLLTLDNDPNIIKMFSTCITPTHAIWLVEGWDKVPLDRPLGWDVVLIDHAPSERRIEDIKRLKGLAKYIVVHDTYWKLEKHYHYKEIYPLFKYRLDYNGTYPCTTILSNFVDLKGLEI